MVPLLGLLAAGTIVEKFHDNDFARAHIYGAWWFYLLLALVGLYSFAALVQALRTGPFKEQLYRVCLYAAVIFVLAGGALTALSGRHGRLTLHPGVPATAFQTDDGADVALPFALTLHSFEVVPYPGTHSPMDFVSHLDVEGHAVDISMNNIYRNQGYRFYQEDYDDEGNSTLSVAHDPWGITVTYLGYLLMLLGIVLCFLSPSSRFRQLLRVPKAAALLLLLAVGVQTLQAAPRTLPRATADRMGQMYVLYKGRVCPVQTLAKDFTTKLYGKATYQGLSPEQVLGGLLFYFNDWAEEPFIKVKDAEVRQLLGIEGRYASYATFMAHADAFAAPRGGAMTGGHAPAMGGTGAMQSKAMRAASEKYNLVQMLMSGKFLKLYPIADTSGALGWYAQNDDLPFTTPDDDYFFIRKQLGYCQELVVEGDYATLEKVFDKTKRYQELHAASALPSAARSRAERLYNRLTTGRWLPMLAVTLGLLLFAVALFRTGSKRSNRDWMHLLSVVAVAALTLFLALIFVLRWISGGHIPMAGGFDSMNLMSIAIGIIALLLVRRQPLAPAIGLLTMGFCQLVAMMSGSNPPVTHLMPVLSSPLLTLHVTVIMISYALFFFVMLLSLAALIARSRRHDMHRLSLLLLYPAVALLALGIVIGALWANISWGNYWSWDPKEVWALITLIVYLFPLLTMQQPKRSTVGFHLYCFLAFFSVIITYFGVNFLLGGIHAYN